MPYARSEHRKVVHNSTVHVQCFKPSQHEVQGENTPSLISAGQENTNTTKYLQGVRCVNINRKEVRSYSRGSKHNNSE